MKSLYLLPSVFALTLTLTETTVAGDITYFAHDTVGMGSVTGSITTDGVLGTLSTSDILSFDLTLNDRNGTASMIGPSGSAVVFISSDNVTATPTLLEFNFNGNGGYMNFYSPTVCSPPEWSFETTGSGTACNGTTGNEWGIAAVDRYGTGTYSPESGEVVFAKRARLAREFQPTTATPEPSLRGVTLILLGVFGIIRVRKGYGKQSGQAA